MFQAEKSPHSSRKRVFRPAIKLILPAIFFLLLWGTAAFGRVSVIVLYLYLIVSTISFVAYLLDKIAAKREKWRTPEKTLHSIDLLCGWPGGLIAQELLRHKTSKRSFQISTWGIVILNCVLLTGITSLFFSN